MTWDGSSSPQSQSLQGHYDLGASVHEDTERAFEPSDNQVEFFEFFEFSYDNNGFTELGVDLQSLPL